jgi:4-amino-4-deoxy-L-arabinose transferase-like glycosyltransferase
MIDYLRQFLFERRAFVWRVFFFALILRLIPVLLARDLGIGLDDMHQYDMLARSIVAGEGFRWYSQPDLDLVQRYLTFDLSSVDYDPRGVVTAFRPPLYPAMLALIYLAVGAGADRFFYARLIQVLLNAILVPLTYFIAKKIFPDDDRPARVASLVVALYPMLIIYPLSLATENLFFVLLLVSVLTLLRAAETRQLRRFALAGIMLGLLALTRSVSLIVGLGCVAWIMFIVRDKKSAAVTFAMILITIAPWMIRNTIVFGRPTIEMSMGYTLYMGYHPQSLGTFQYGISLDLMQTLDDAERDRQGIEQGLQFIKDDPIRAMILPIYRAGYFFGLERRALSYFYANNFFGFIPFPILISLALILVLPFVIVSTSAVYGVAQIANLRRRNSLLLLIVIVCYIAPHLLLLGEDRFHLTLVPLLAIFAAYCWHNGRVKFFLDAEGAELTEENLLSPRPLISSSPRLLFFLSLLICSLLFFNWGYEIVRDWEQLTCLFGAGGNQCWFAY